MIFSEENAQDSLDNAMSADYNMQGRARVATSERQRWHALNQDAVQDRRKNKAGMLSYIYD
jgi:hypothetical protein